MVLGLLNRTNSLIHHHLINQQTDLHDMGIGKKCLMVVSMHYSCTRMPPHTGSSHLQCGPMQMIPRHLATLRPLINADIFAHLSIPFYLISCYGRLNWSFLGLLPRIDEEIRTLPRYKPKNVWDEKSALFGQNDYIGKYKLIQIISC